MLAYGKYKHTTQKNYGRRMFKVHRLVAEAGYDPSTFHKCNDCKEFKSFGTFSKNRTRASGYNNICKSCDSTRQKERYSRRVA